ncbi:DNA primase [Athalassotoga saccharophila]|uniref:DNA primase n=1 Tax=Athalassotoga saccharophila TaxID=1441386 RepID=UPI00137A9B3A|nr:DNA primase [Athalassotoga saccharophila]BBJ28809.1 DNA primase [Athalassotoga saccharophila]
MKSLEEFKSQCDIVKVVSHYVVLEKAGSNYRGLCPFHEEKTPSFYVNAEKGFFHCFGCGASGDVIEFVKKIENLSFGEAVQKVADLCGIESPLTGKDDEFSKYVKFTQMLSKTYTDMIFSPIGKNALSYLLNERKMSMEDLKEFEIGYAPPNSTVTISVAKKVGFEEQKLFSYGFLSRGKNGSTYEFFRDRIIFPIKNSSGKIVAFGGRAIGNVEPKYLNSPENRYFSKSKVLYLFDRAKEKMKSFDFAIICEGYMDAIAFHKNGFVNSVAVLGVNLTENHIESIKNFTKNLLLVLDSDRAGVNAMEKLSKVLSKYDLNVKVLTFTDAKDPDEYFRVHNRDDFKKTLDGALDYWEFYVRSIIGNTVDLPKAVKKFADATKWIESPILKNTLSRIAAKTLMIDEKEMMYEMKTIYSNNLTPEKVKIERMSFEDSIVYLLFAGDEVRSRLISEIEDNYLSNFTKKIFDLVKDGHTSPQEIIKMLDENESKRFFKIITYDPKIQNMDEAVNMIIVRLRERKIKSEIAKLESEMKSTEDSQKKKILQNKMLSLYAVLKGKRGDIDGR